jgi:hypothetical protein
MLSQNVSYNDLGDLYLDRLNQHHLARNLVRPPWLLSANDQRRMSLTLLIFIAVKNGDIFKIFCKPLTNL